MDGMTKTVTKRVAAAASYSFSVHFQMRCDILHFHFYDISERKGKIKRSTGWPNDFLYNDNPKQAHSFASKQTKSLFIQIVSGSVRYSSRVESIESSNISARLIPPLRPLAIHAHATRLYLSTILSNIFENLFAYSTRSFLPRSFDLLLLTVVKTARHFLLP